MLKSFKNFWILLRGEDKVLIVNSFWNMSGTALSKMIMLSASILVARNLGATLFGQWGVILSTVTMFTTFLSYGFGVTVMKHLAENKDKNPSRASIIFSITLFSSLIFGIVLSLLMYSSSNFLSSHVLRNPEIKLPLQISSFYILITAFSGVFSGSLMGLNVYKRVAYSNLVASFIGAPIVIFATYNYKIIGVSVGYLIYYIIISLLYVPALIKEFKKAGIKVTIKGLKTELPLLYKFSLPAMISGAIGGPVIWIANALVARMADGYTIIGIFNAAKIVQSAVSEIGNQIHNPLITLISHNKSKRSNTLSYLAPVLYITVFVLPLIHFPELTEWMFAKGNYLIPKFDVLISLTLITGYVTIFKQSLGRSIILNDKVWWGVYENILWTLILLSIIIPLTTSFAAIGLSLTFLIAYFLDLIIIFPFYKKAKILPGYILYNKFSVFLWLSIFIAPFFLFLGLSFYIRLLLYIISVSIHYLYLMLLKKSS
jgi:O-antigen/teichoic acid export membrane protein